VFAVDVMCFTSATVAFTFSYATPQFRFVFGTSEAIFDSG
jgi:hypothetical protein